LPQALPTGTANRALMGFAMLFKIFQLA